MLGLLDLSFLPALILSPHGTPTNAGEPRKEVAVLWSSTSSSFSYSCPSVFPLRVNERGWDRKVPESCNEYSDLSSLFLFQRC